jgi:hypothetical protein
MRTSAITDLVLEGYSIEAAQRRAALNEIFGRLRNAFRNPDELNSTDAVNAAKDSLVQEIGNITITSDKISDEDFPPMDLGGAEWRIMLNLSQKDGSDWDSTCPIWIYCSIPPENFNAPDDAVEQIAKVVGRALNREVVHFEDAANKVCGLVVELGEIPQAVWEENEGNADWHIKK